MLLEEWQRLGERVGISCQKSNQEREALMKVNISRVQPEGGG